MVLVFIYNYNDFCLFDISKPGCGPNTLLDIGYAPCTWLGTEGSSITTNIHSPSIQIPINSRNLNFSANQTITATDKTDPHKPNTVGVL
jgi:hypothetical protein